MPPHLKINSLRFHGQDLRCYCMGFVVLLIIEKYSGLMKSFRRGLVRLEKHRSCVRNVIQYLSDFVIFSVADEILNTVFSSIGMGETAHTGLVLAAAGE